MKILVTGAHGQLGHDVMKELKKRGHEAFGPSSRELDITDAGSVKKVLNQFLPDAVIHCAGWTAVDDAERTENRERVFAINRDGSANLAAYCAETGARMLYISTDYVFDGNGTEPWQPDCKDYAPISVYGQSKLEGELAVASAIERYFIVRIAWLFGINGKNFVRTMLSAGRTHDSVRVVCDQIGTPTYAADLARLLVDMIESDRYGYYHATNEGGFISWYDFTKEIYSLAGLHTQVIPVTTAEYGSPAKRPFNSRLDKSKLKANGFEPLPDWRDALSRYLKELESNG